jgi:polysaccharide pyruvyl transferase WcaK-like protein
MLPQWIAPGELATKMSIWNTSHSIGAFCAVVVCGLLMTNMGADMSGDSSIVARISSNLAGSIKGWDDLPLADIGYITGQAPGTVATRLHRIRHKLYQLIKQIQDL